MIKVNIIHSLVLKINEWLSELSWELFLGDILLFFGSPIETFGNDKFFDFDILKMKSLLNVVALKNIKLFSVDKTVAISAAKNNPFKPGLNISFAKAGKANTGFSKLGKIAFEYSPVVFVRKSNNIQKKTEITIPHFATFPLIAE